MQKWYGKVSIRIRKRGRKGGRGRERGNGRKRVVKRKKKGSKDVCNNK